MTTVKRIGLILAAALAIVAGTLGLAQTGLLNLRGGDRRGFDGGGEFRPGAGAPAFDQGQFPQRSLEGDRGFGELRERGDRFGGGLFGLGDVFKNLVIVALIVAAVVLGSLALDRIRRGRRPAPGGG